MFNEYDSSDGDEDENEVSAPTDSTAVYVREDGPGPKIIRKPEIRPVTAFLVSVVDSLVEVNDKSIGDRLKPLVSNRNDDNEMVEDFLSVIAAFCDRVSEAGRRSKVAKRSVEMFHGDAIKHKFAMRLITSNVFGRGRMHAVNFLGYSKVSPFIVVDHFFDQVNDQMTRMVLEKLGDNEGVMEAVIFVARNYRNPDTVIARLRQIECFQHHDFVVKAESWDKRNLRRFVALICRVIGISPPREVRGVYLDVVLEPCVSALLNGSAELEDFIPICRNLVGPYDECWNDIIDYVATRSDTLAAAVAALVGKGKGKGKGSEKDEEITFPQNCLSPFNEVLHSLPHVDGVVVDSLDTAVDFGLCLQQVKQYAVDFYDTARVEDVRARASVITFVMQKGIFFVLPRLFPEACEAVGRALKQDRHVVFNFKWSFDQVQFKATFGFIPKNVIQAGEVAKEIGLSPKLDAICERVTGGSICLRASLFSDLELPSSHAFQHRALRTCVIYDFVAEARKLTKRRDAVQTTEGNADILPPRDGRQRRRSRSRSRNRSGSRSRSRGPEKKKPERETSRHRKDKKRGHDRSHDRSRWR